ncbi:UNVERIFIED_ORG: hypothetical protein ABIB13_002538 [Arthrobacter sp. UYEF2]
MADKADYVLMDFQVLAIVFFVALSMGSAVATSGGGGLMWLGLELHPLFRSPPSLGKLLLKMTPKQPLIAPL